MTFKYYSLLRPVSIGTYPKKDIKGHTPIEIGNFDDRKEVESGVYAWGYVVYKHPLLSADMYNYELRPVGVNND